MKNIGDHNQLSTNCVAYKLSAKFLSKPTPSWYIKPIRAYNDIHTLKYIPAEKSSLVATIKACLIIS